MQKNPSEKVSQVNQFPAKQELEVMNTDITGIWIFNLKDEVINFKAFVCHISFNCHPTATWVIILVKRHKIGFFPTELSNCTDF